MSEEILIVDDNSDIRNIINELIMDAGYKTRLAANYNQALGEIDKKLPDVAILDVKLDKGDNDGIELLSHIKSKNKDIGQHKKFKNHETAFKFSLELLTKYEAIKELYNNLNYKNETINIEVVNVKTENELIDNYNMINKNTELQWIIYMRQGVTN